MANKRLTKDEKKFVEGEMDYMGPGNPDAPRGTKGAINGK